MSEADLQGKRVALLGYGLENKALLPYLKRSGCELTILDHNESLAIPDGVAARLGQNYLEDLTDFEIIFRSPGIPYLTRELQAAKQQGVIITSQTKLFLEQCPCAVIGVTGTKGKSTTASLIEACLSKAVAAGRLPGKIHLVGNIGRPPIEVLPLINRQDWVVFELSSFQLQDLTVSPNIAVVLNVSLDHLDHHRDEAEYISAKKNIVRYQTPSDFLILSLDSLTSMLFADESPAQAYFYSRLKSVDRGCYLLRQLGDDQLILRLPGREDEVICRRADLKLVGQFAVENAAAAAAAAALAGADTNSIREGLTEFTGLPHRLELVGTAKDVRYYNDSKSTTPDSTAAAILSFTDPITLILGGVTKGADYQDLAKLIPGTSVKHIICIGQSANELSELFTEYFLPSDNNTGPSITIESGEMTNIVTLAESITPAGGIVLLSPAAASFDMFKNAEDRGEQFRAAVLKLPGYQPAVKEVT